MKREEFHFAAVYETRLVENAALTIVTLPVKVYVLTGPAHAYRLSREHVIIPLKDEQERTRLTPSPPIDFEQGKRYLIVSTSSRELSDEAEQECRRIVLRIAAIIGLLSSPRVFALPIYIGWLSPTPAAIVHSNIMIEHSQTLDRESIEHAIAVARRVLADSEMRDKFDLIARLFSRTIGVPPSEEAYLWAWTCLEVFPMRGTQKYRHIAPYLASITGRTEAEIAGVLDIRGLHALRSKLVHAGHLGITRPELYRKLGDVQAMVRTVMRGMCGLPYAGELDHLFPDGA